MACDPRKRSRELFKNSAICFDTQTWIHLYLRMRCRIREPVYMFYMTPNRLGLYGQVNKRTWWMPWRQKAMKDVVACDKLRGAGKYASIRRFPNGETHLLGGTFN